MDEPTRKTCDLCGERPATGQIYFSYPLSATEQETYGTTAAELDKRLCEACGARVFKHIKRMFTLEDLGLKRSSKKRAARLY